MESNPSSDLMTIPPKMSIQLLLHGKLRLDINGRPEVESCANAHCRFEERRNITDRGRTPACSMTLTVASHSSRAHL
uniref:Uncharacterized protein n=1 Tax=Anguilla anguilla TaxID=7936 RepID=A0A0E9QL96_ANGAN